jgi:PhoU domain
VGQLCKMDNAVDRLHEAIKLYVAKVTRESLDDQDGRRAMEIIAFAINLEHIGDIIDKDLMELSDVTSEIRRSERGEWRAAGRPAALREAGSRCRGGGFAPTRQECRRSFRRSADSATNCREAADFDR